MDELGFKLRDCFLSKGYIIYEKMDDKYIYTIIINALKKGIGFYKFPINKIGDVEIWIAPIEVIGFAYKIYKEYEEIYDGINRRDEYIIEGSENNE